MSTPTAAVDATADPAARIGELRTEIDACDAGIIELVQRRLAISREIGALRTEIDACDAAIIGLVQRRLAISQEIGRLRAAVGGTRLSLSREQQILATFRDALGPDGAALGMLLLRQGRGRL